VVSNFVGLVEHVQNSLQLIEQTIARETSPETSPGGPEGSTDIIVLDDASLRYIKATTALQACDAGLGIALRFRSSARKADAALARWSARCCSTANFLPNEERGHASPENASGRLRRAGVRPRGRIDLSALPLLFLASRPTSS
jgi:hypothetical protein